MPKYGTTSKGSGWTNQQIIDVWNKGKIDPRYDRNRYRLDAYGSWMDLTLYGDATQDMGWEIDHIIPLDKGGTDHISNLQPLQWRNNRRKSNN